MRRRDVLRTVGAAALVAPAVRSAQAQTKTLVFGGSVPLTGAAAETGLNVNNGYITAVSYLNDKLGGVEIAGEKYKLELKLFDDASDPARATTLIQRQIDDGTNFFLGSFGSNIVLPTAAITERAEKPMVQAGGGSDQIFTQGYRYVFGFFPRATGIKTPRSWRYGTRSPSCSGSWARTGRGSPPPTGRSWPPCCTASHATCSAGSGCRSSRTRCCAGTGTCWPAATRPDPGPGAPAGPAPSAPPYGRSSTTPGSTRHPTAPLPPGPASSAPRPTPCSPAISSRRSP